MRLDQIFKILVGYPRKKAQPLSETLISLEFSVEWCRKKSVIFPLQNQDLLSGIPTGPEEDIMNLLRHNGPIHAGWIMHRLSNDSAGYFNCAHIKCIHHTTVRRILTPVKREQDSNPACTASLLPKEGGCFGPSSRSSLESCRWGNILLRNTQRISLVFM